ncbi:hypothetical protein GUITHDRAFT_114528 [Guillardia theta CCMP2712]|uniref:Molybdate-anion transporter n=1 Tax=Guillardia theta (strain CCMP2712) TaxID=905079 RepID=L1ITC0_GUITC|nr:hypothetical protein GUITHDRAFT_114528 [Guillardia theta CCMP2712]EKX39327.1 hypothetical protein GUITHDRAFT_114528 [Guillardia theta CCMP2712]|eukprot:XP_005826307.1 hypothetical protein GUITHDRAFT_114528 [Guillardia theta CCMP2712]
MRDLKQIPLRSQDRQTLRRFTSEGLSETSSRKVHGDVLRVRGGGSLDFSRPETVFNTYLAGLAAFCALLRVVGLSGSNKVVSVANEKYQKLKTNYLAVFWAFKLADWLHGPYFYSVYASKKHNGKPLGEDLIGKLFLCGFGASMIFGTVAGSLVDTIGRKAGTATSLLFSAPEAWLVGEHGKQGGKGSWLSGPSGPFELSVLFLSLGTALVGLSWGENYGGNQKVSASKKNIFTSLRDAMRIILDDRKILLTGLIQSLFEGAMYIFVLQWPPGDKTMARVMSSSPPYGTIFACLMTACMIGSSLFGILMKTSMMIETIMIGMLGCSSIALALAGHIMHHLPDASFAMHVLAGCFLLFEV